MKKNFINLQLFGIDYLTCDICGEGFPDVIDYSTCHECGSSFCCDDCRDDGDLTYRYYKDGDEVDKDEDYDYSEVSSCKFCRHEDFKDDEMLIYLLKKNNLTVNELKKEMKEKKKNV